MWEWESRLPRSSDAAGSVRSNRFAPSASPALLGATTGRAVTSKRRREGTTLPASARRHACFSCPEHRLSERRLLIGDWRFGQAQGFEVVMPDIAQLTRSAISFSKRLVISARALADDPIWLVGPSQRSSRECPSFSGAKSPRRCTSVTSNAGVQPDVSNRSPGPARTRVTVKTSGDACGTATAPWRGARPLGEVIPDAC